MAIAPSEKHLEDWIVANLVRFTPENEIIPGWPSGPFLEAVAARQLRLPHGIADIVGRKQESILVAELKKDFITPETIAQTCRYIYDLQEVFYNSFTTHVIENPLGRIEFDYAPEYTLPNMMSMSPEVRGLIVGKRISNTNLITACYAAHIEVVFYDFIDGEYVFQEAETEYIPTFNSPYEQVSKGAVGDAIKEVMRWRVAHQSHEVVRKARLQS